MDYWGPLLLSALLAGIVSHGESYTALLTEAIYLQLCVSNLFFKTGE